MIEISLPRINVREVDGTPAEGWQLFFYEAGSSTVLKDTFADAALTTPNANPVLSLADGWFPAIILNGSYNVVLRKSVAAGSPLVWSQDNITDIKTTINALIAEASALDQSTRIRNQQYTYAVGSGTGDAISLVITPTPSAYVDGMRVQVRGYTGANTVTAPTINVNSLGTRPIVKDANSPLVPGDIAGATHTIDLIYSSALSKFILQNPRGVHYLPVTAEGTADALTATVSGFSALYDGMRICVVASANATSRSPTLDLNSSGAVTIKRSDGTILSPTDITSGKVLDLYYNHSDTSWRMMNTLPDRVDYITGLICSSDTDADHDVKVSAGSCSDSSSEFYIELGAEITKQIDSSWSEGDNLGGLASSITLSGPQWLYFFVIAKSDGTVDAGFDDNASATNLLSDASGYTAYRHIASVYTNSSNNIHFILNNQEIGLGRIMSLTGSGNFVSPPLVKVLGYKATGGGGGGGGRGSGAGSGSEGGDSTLNGTIIAAGGGGGHPSASGSRSGGVASGGNINIIGGDGASADGGSVGTVGGASFWGGGGGATSAASNGRDAYAYGSGGGGAHGSSGAAGSGSAAGTCIGILSVTPGDLIPYVVGAGGAGGTGTQTGGAGAPGIIVLEF